MEENIGGNATISQETPNAAAPAETEAQGQTAETAQAPESQAQEPQSGEPGQGESAQGGEASTGGDQSKTPEQLKAEKAEKFAKEPDKFICLDDVVMAVVKTPAGGYGTFLGAFKRFEMEIALTRVTYKTMNMFMHMDMQRELEQEANRRVIVKNAPLPPKEFAKRMRR